MIYAGTSKAAEVNDRTSFFANDVDADMVVQVVEQLSVVWETDPDLRAQE